MKSVIDEINVFQFADYSLEKVILDHGNNQIKFFIHRYDLENKNCITCNEYIGYAEVGIWDEAIIESIRIEKEGSLLLNSKNTIKNNYPNPDIPFMQKNILDTYFQLTIKLIDGILIVAVAKSFTFEEVD